MNIIEMFNIADKGDVQLLESLKKALTDNSYKHCYIGAEMMLNEMEDMGLDSEAVATYKIVAANNLPYGPTDIK